jgi:porphobilinogen synthase
MVAEHRLDVADLIWPVFVLEGRGLREPVASMPGIDRLSIDALLPALEDAAKLGVPAVALFPVTPTELKSADGREATNPDNLICRAVRADAKENNADADKNVADAIADNDGDDIVDQARDANEAAAKGDSNVRIAQAEAAHKVANEKCEALSGASQKECKDRADAALDQAKQAAKAMR